ncbi:MAG TPA: hypothetical protein PKC91_15565 [Ignavibacteria bacterium]|nr:hypothetical protein [Ignavibacteria bacterium]
MIDKKKNLAKEKSPAGEKLPEILSQWQQKSQYWIPHVPHTFVYHFILNLITLSFIEIRKKIFFKGALL